MSLSFLCFFFFLPFDRFLDEDTQERGIGSRPTDYTCDFVVTVMNTAPRYGIFPKCDKIRRPIGRCVCVRACVSADVGCRILTQVLTKHADTCAAGSRWTRFGGEARGTLGMPDSVKINTNYTRLRRVSPGDPEGRVIPGDSYIALEERDARERVTTRERVPRVVAEG